MKSQIMASGSDVGSAPSSAVCARRVVPREIKIEARYARRIISIIRRHETYLSELIESVSLHGQVDPAFRESVEWDRLRLKECERLKGILYVALNRRANERTGANGGAPRAASVGPRSKKSLKE